MSDTGKSVLSTCSCYGSVVLFESILMFMIFQETKLRDFKPVLTKIVTYEFPDSHV